MKYFRYHTWGIRLFLFLTLTFFLAVVAYYILLKCLPVFTGIRIDQIQPVSETTPRTIVNVSIIVQGILSCFAFLIPALLFAYLTHPQSANYLGLRPAGRGIQYLLVVLIMLGALPVLEKIGELIGHINFDPKIRAEQAESEGMFKAYLVMPDFVSFLRAFIVIAIVPAFGEELFFRGVMFRLTRQVSRSFVLPIVITAIIFSLSHTNIYGYLSIFLAGVLLAVVYYLTSSLWCSIIGHLVFNGLQVVLAFMSNSSTPLRSFMEKEEIPWGIVIGGAVLFIVSFYLLLKNKTPMSDDWVGDFTPAELAQEAE